jgi:hypothetical protein
MRGGKGGYEGEKHSGEGDFWREHYFSYWETVLEHFWGGRLEDCITGFWLEKLVVGLLQGGTCCWEFWARGPGILTESWS